MPRISMSRLVRRPRLWGAAVVLAATGLAMAHVYNATHQIYPDTQFYLAWTLRLLGHDGPNAQQIVHDYIRDQHVFTPYPHLWGSLTGRLGTKPRILLPLLSAPFVAWLGPGGIVVVPAIAFVVAMYLIYRFGTVHASVPAAAVACVLPLLSLLVVKWSIGGLTDSLAVLLHAAMFLLLPWQRRTTWWNVAGVCAVCALSGAARLITPFTVAAMAGLWLWAMLRQPGRRWSWSAVTAGAAVGVLLATAWTRWASTPLTSRNQIYAMTEGRARTFREALPWYSEQLPLRAHAEFDKILTSEPLVILIVLSLVACVTAWRTVVPWLVLPAWLGAAGVFLINPAVTEFRYELPALPALVVAVAVLADQAARAARWLARRAGRRASGAAAPAPTDDRPPKPAPAAEPIAH